MQSIFPPFGQDKQFWTTRQRTFGWYIPITDNHFAIAIHFLLEFFTMKSKRFRVTPTFPSAEELAEEIGLTEKDKRIVNQVSKKHKSNAAFMKPVQPDSALSTVVGTKAIPRTEVTKKLWAYIKKNNLQDKKKKTTINADNKLKAVFGGKKTLTLLEMTRLVSKHVKE
jgi:chromatin remodeling complex protein RSC6